MLCDCNNPKKCILRNKKAFAQYNREREIIAEQRAAAICPCGCGLTICEDDEIFITSEYRGSAVVNKKIYSKKNMMIISKCAIVKHFHIMDTERRELLAQHNETADLVEKLKDGINKGYNMNLKLKELLKNSMSEHMKALKSHRTADFEYLEQKETLKKLKMENKRLKFIICSSGTGEDDEDEGEDEDEDEDTANYAALYSQNEEPTKKDENGRENINILKLYENLKSYMIRNKCGIGTIARRNKANITRMKNKFITIKHDRILTAHPKEDTITDDGEFLQLISDY